jgi:hypothetical protein
MIPNSAGSSPAFRQVFMLWVFTTALMIFLGRASLGQDEAALKPQEVTGVVVDDAGKPVAGVEVDTRESTLAKPGLTDDRGAFRFLIERDPGGIASPGSVVARDGDARLGLARLSPFAETIKPLRIVLKKPKNVKIRVVDGSDLPLVNVSVRFEVNGAAFSLGSTDANGNLSLRLPDEPRDWRVGAFKGAVGYDYERSPRPVAPSGNPPPPPLPEEVTLRLTGARRPVRIRTIDHQGKPVAHVRILIGEKAGPSPFGFAKPGQTTSGPVPPLVTGEDGSITIDWLPTWIQRELTYTGSALDRKHLAREISVTCDASTGEVKLVMLPMQTVSGRITLGDGKPAAGANVRMISLTRTEAPFHAQTPTDRDGRYRSSVRSQDAYVLYASLNEAAELRRDALLVTPDKPVTNIDLAIARATEFKGRVLLDRDGKKLASFGIISVWTYIGALAPEVRELLPGSPKQSPVVMIGEFYRNRKDEEFRLLLPRGSYTVRFSYIQDKTAQIHDVAISIPQFFPPLEIKRDLILSEIPKVK